MYVYQSTKLTSPTMIILYRKPYGIILTYSPFMFRSPQEEPYSSGLFSKGAYFVNFKIAVIHGIDFSSGLFSKGAYFREFQNCCDSRN